MPTITTKTDISDIFPTGILAALEKAYTEQPSDPIWKAFTAVEQVAPGTTAFSLPAISSVPAMTEWTAERTVGSLTSDAQAVTIKTYQTAVQIARTAVDSQSFGMVNNKVQELAAKAAEFYAKTAFGVINGSMSTLCMDGQNLCDTDHPIAGPSTQSNKLTLALSATNLATAMTTMQTLVSPQSLDPLNRIPRFLVVPPALRGTAEELCYSIIKPYNTTAAGVQTNVSNWFAGKLELIVSPYITDTTSWFLLADGWSKPAVIVEADPVEFQQATDGDTVFMYDAYSFGARVRLIGVPGDYTSIVGSTGGD